MGRSLVRQKFVTTYIDFFGINQYSMKGIFVFLELPLMFGSLQVPKSECNIKFDFFDNFNFLKHFTF